ncbi:N-acetyl-D-Glu racemase DgcA [Asticcacaulis excentricus]|uniref:Dipeptide epimerase n=1 Tax=Asticcacaulis excentricus (strain ATCC 15261 / DSM 4724 / KCTC 12464 / NCIMB 9791 / VKM B-1370 / CB 48) TaxID=573065 RepID=E8RKT0_ASTEC|nr:N-acetyl-D-Glu racemase DgcA [Asticcacaulis excentricus]ADU12490.1 Mandelate racemase/muconate lactonizing protein [Asticcacaulis excentricus CB 48]
MRLTCRSEAWPIAGRFTIARGSKTEAHVLYIEVTDGLHTGRGEAVPYARYGETVEGALAALDAARPAIEAGQIPALTGAAANALDCALWDLRAKASGVPAWQTAGLHTFSPLKTAYTLSLDTPEAMGAQAAANARRPLLKLKIGGPDDLARVEAVRRNAPRTRLIVDANEGLTLDSLKALAPELQRLGVVLIEQPLKAGEDDALEGYKCPVPLCADESLHTRVELERCARLYDAVNIKLDKTGGLTEALALKQAAQGKGLRIMVGCMVATSLSMAPAMIVAQGADFVDLDGPLLLAKDREHGLKITGSMLEPPEPALWG